jgi:hypothetical protein
MRGRKAKRTKVAEAVEADITWGERQVKYKRPKDLEK